MTTWVNAKEWVPQDHISVLCVIQKDKKDPNLDYEVCFCYTDESGDEKWFYQHEDEGKKVKGEVKYWTLLPAVIVKD